MSSSKITRPTLPKVQRDLAGFSDSLVLYVYHHLNGREEEANSYLEEYKQEQEAYANELRIQLQEIQSQQDMRIDN